MDARRSVQHAVFFALCPDRRTADEARCLALGLELKPAQRLHVSLVGLGDDDGPQPRWAEKAAAAASAVRRPPFLIELDTVSSFGPTREGRWAAVLRGEDGAIGLNMLCDAILASLAREGLRGRAAHTPHLTIAWSERFVAEHRTQPVRWIAREFLLIHSLQGAGRHEVLGRWPLMGETAHASNPAAGGN